MWVDALVKLKENHFSIPILLIPVPKKKAHDFTLHRIPQTKTACKQCKDKSLLEPRVGPLAQRMAAPIKTSVTRFIAKATSFCTRPDQIQTAEIVRTVLWCRFVGGKIPFFHLTFLVIVPGLGMTYREVYRKWVNFLSLLIVAARENPGNWTFSWSER